MRLLLLSWTALSWLIALLQLLAISQPEWIVSGYDIQGLYALCTAWDCVIRDWNSLLPLLFEVIGTLLYIITAFFLLIYLFSFPKSRSLRFMAKLQAVATVAMAICLLLVPFDMHEMHCSLRQLLTSPSCKVGWAMALSAVCTMLSIACPILGSVSAEERKRYRILDSQEHYI